MARLEGFALVTLVVDDDATLRDVHITRPIGLGLDEKAIAAVKDWQFAPATEGEKPVQAVTRVDVNFRLLIGRDDWHLSRAAFDTAPGTDRPVLISAEYPEAQKSEDYAAVTVSFTIDEQGVPTGVHADKSSDPKWELEIVQMVTNWRFHPALSGGHGGHAVRAGCTLDFARGHLTASE